MTKSRVLRTGALKLRSFGRKMFRIATSPLPILEHVSAVETSRGRKTDTWRYLLRNASST